MGSASRGARWAIAGALACGLLAACNSVQTFACDGDSECGPDGQCEEAGVCSFPDTLCPSGRRYGEHAGDLSKSCVGVEGSTGAPESSSSSTEDPPPLPTTEPPPDSSSSSGGDTTGPVLPETTSGDASTTTSDPSGEDSSSSTGPPPERVSEGLLALYNFDAEMGVTVEDVSGVDPPLPLTLQGAGFMWDSGTLRKNSADSIILAEGSPSKIRLACIASEELTLEAWITPGADDQDGPARIITYSTDATLRNFTLGQGSAVGAKFLTPGYSARLRTEPGDPNGLPTLDYQSPVATSPTHLVFVHESDGTEQLYIDGEFVLGLDRPGSLVAWEAPIDGMAFALGNEITLSRGWIGEFHLVAVFERALSAQDVEQNFAAGF